MEVMKGKEQTCFVITFKIRMATHLRFGKYLSFVQRERTHNTSLALLTFTILTNIARATKSLNLVFHLYITNSTSVNNILHYYSYESSWYVYAYKSW
jgi:hypothetical protein